MLTFIWLFLKLKDLDVHYELFEKLFMSWVYFEVVGQKEPTTQFLLCYNFMISLYQSTSTTNINYTFYVIRLELVLILIFADLGIYVDGSGRRSRPIELMWPAPPLAACKCAIEISFKY